MKTPTVENCDLPDIDKFSKILAKKLEKDVPHIIDTYTWPIRRKKPNRYETFKFKINKSCAFAKIEEDGSDQIPWIKSILRWGGIYRNNDKTLRYYASLDNDILCKTPRGIASWSKILAFREPKKYFIYDYRVAFSLNYLLATNSDNIEYNNFIFLPPSRRKDAKICREKLLILLNKNSKDKNIPCAELSDPDSYNFYIQLIEKTSEILNLNGFNKQKIEMTLFMKFECYTKKVSELQ